MGCDIHFNAERRRADGTWEEVTPARLIAEARALEDPGDVPHEVRLQAALASVALEVAALVALEEASAGGESWLAAYDAHRRLTRWTSERNYQLFGRLAGVRDPDVEPISEPRGLPEDLSEAVRIAQENESDHSHSWLFVEELTPAPDQSPFKGQGPLDYWKRFEGRIAPLRAHAATLPPKSVRVIFGFDS